MRPTLPALALATLACASCSTLLPEAEKAVTNIEWTTPDFQRPIEQTVNCQTIGLIVTTRGYVQGETVRVTLIDKDNPRFEQALYGTVDADSKARIRWENGGCIP